MISKSNRKKAEKKENPFEPKGAAGALYTMLHDRVCTRGPQWANPQMQRLGWSVSEGGISRPAGPGICRQANTERQ